MQHLFYELLLARLAHSPMLRAHAGLITISLLWMLSLFQGSDNGWRKQEMAFKKCSPSFFFSMPTQIMINVFIIFWYTHLFVYLRFNERVFTLYKMRWALIFPLLFHCINTHTHAGHNGSKFISQPLNGSSDFEKEMN